MCGGHATVMDLLPQTTCQATHLALDGGLTLLYTLNVRY